MFVHRSRLPHVLAPACYHDVRHHERELERVLRPRWHVVATLDELAEPGDFVTAELLGEPLLIRRGAHGLEAFSNVCPHRYSQLSAAPRGRMPRLRCGYHGWCFDDRGTLTDLPDAPSFASPPGKRPLVGRLALARHRVATLGPLVLVSLGDAPSEVGDAFSEGCRELLAAHQAADYELILAERLDHPCNWKIPIENVLETYHVGELHQSWLARHPRLVRVFGDAEAPEAAQHRLGADFSEYRDRMGAEFLPYRLLVRSLAGITDCSYRHHHSFPNLIVAATPILTFVQSVTPRGPTRSQSLVRLWLRQGGPRAARGLVAEAARRFLTTVLCEDAAIYPSVQRGVEAARRPGVLGAREERVWAFQRWLADATGEP
ncbi:MAG: aromatic ring-hydroxylating dioxygenase subunit alpha [Polyangiaceae bacterium]